MVSNMSRDRFCRSPIKVESGVATLVTAVVLMLAVFGISFYLSEVVIKEKQSVSVKQRGFEAFNSAMAGLDLGIFSQARYRRWREHVYVICDDEFWLV